MAGRVLRSILMIPLALVVLVLVIIGLVDFDLLVAITPKVISAIVVVGAIVLMARMIFWPRR